MDGGDFIIVNDDDDDDVVLLGWGVGSRCCCIIVKCFRMLSKNIPKQNKTSKQKSQKKEANKQRLFLNDKKAAN